MTKQRFCFTFFLLICFSLPLTATAQTVNIPDPSLRDAVENALRKPSGATITRADMANLTQFIAANANIRDLTGLEVATNLSFLFLGAEYVFTEDRFINSNSISDLSPLAGLTKLVDLGLGSNSISDISPLAGLNNLKVLGLEKNSISNLSPLAGLTNLTELYLSDNSISNLSPLAGLTKLTRLELWGNNISNISPLAGLTKLRGLFLWGNSISDISPLAGLNNLTRLDLEDNSITDISPLVENTGLGSGDIVWLEGNPLNAASINTHIPALERRGVSVVSDAVVTPGVNIPDPSLRAAIERALGKAPGAPITTTDMADLTELTARDADIGDLTGLEYAINLTRLNLRSNSISDISPLAELNNLRNLDLVGNSISDILPLANLTNLTFLNLWGSSISDISPLANLTNLTFLNLADNSISDISPLERLTNLTSLPLDNNSISDISPLAGLTNLTYLSLYQNSISDISPLAGLNNLTSLGLGNNFIADISPLEGLNNIEELGLNDNSISDISPLEGLNNLTFVRLDDNSISDISPLVANTGLGTGDEVNVNENPLNHASINTHIPTLRRRGVTVESDAVVTEGVNIPDPNLRAAIGRELGKASGDTITTVDMAKLTRLVAPNANISDLTGLEGATNLTALDLGTEQVQQRVWRNSNSITDIAALQGLTKLEVLDLENNSITDISTVARLTSLTELTLRDNSIENISAVRGLTNLKLLNLSGNPITDISVVAGLTNLTDLFLRNNLISDISPLAGLNKLTVLNLDFNSISNISPLTALTNLEILALTYNNISDISPLAGLNQLVLLALTHNSISDLSPLVENRGLGSGNLVYVSENPLNAASINDHVPDLQRRGVTITFDDVVTEPVNIPDPNLRAAIEAELGKASGDTITTVDMANLTELEAESADISDLTGLEAATNLTWLELWGNSISDLSPLANLTSLTHLWLSGNPISDLSPLANLTNLTHLFFGDNIISDLSPLANLTNLTRLSLWNNSISDLSPLAGLTNLTELNLGENAISDISPLANLTNLTELLLFNNSISDISAVEGLTNLKTLDLNVNSITDISSLVGLTELTELYLGGNSISDILPLVANTGLGNGDEVSVSANPLNSQSINTHIPTLQSRGVEVRAENLKPTTSEYTLTMLAGISLIHVPLKVTAVNRSPKTIESISDLYDVLGGAGTVNFLITYDSISQEWRSYFVPSDKGGPDDSGLTDDMGILVGLRTPVSVHLRGTALGANGNSSINLGPGLNLVGLPLNDSRINRVSDLFDLDGIGGNVPVIILTDGGEFKLVGRAGDPGDIEITGGQAFIMTASRPAAVNISGDAWANGSGTAAAPPVTFKGIEVGDTTPVLGLRGSIVNEGTGLNRQGFRVTVKNLSTRKAVAAITSPDEAGYRLTVVDIETGRAATIGDTLEISAQSPNPFIGVKPLRYTVTAEDVKQSLIQLPALVAYEIPAETQLLANYPNPFNPETWIPYRLAEDAFVTLTIYDLNGQSVRTLDVGHQTAAVYENRSKAIYWDGRNEIGEPVASGVYFYHLSVGDYSATRKMVILK